MTATPPPGDTPPMPSRKLDPAWTAPLLYLALGLAFLAVPLYNAATRPNCERNKDYTFWWEIGLDVRAGLPLYSLLPGGEVKFLYPPPLAVMLYAPLTHLGPIGLVLALGALTAIAWAVSVWASLVLLTGRWRGHPRWWYLAPGLAVSTYIWDIQLLGQINLVLLMLVLLSVLALRARFRSGAAALFAAPVAMKAFPLPAIVYFAARREWHVVAMSLVFMGAYLWFVPGLVRGFDRNTAELQQWVNNMIADQSGQTTAARSGIGFTRRNHSLVSVSHRLLRDVNAGDDPVRKLTVNVANLSPRACQWIGMGACLALGAVLLIATRCRFATSPLAEGLEVAMVCMLVLLCSPLSHTYFYCWLLPAWTAVAVLWKEHRAARIGGGIAILFFVSSLSELFNPLLQAYGVTTWGTVTLFFTLAHIRYRLPDDSNTVKSPWLDRLFRYAFGGSTNASGSLKPGSTSSPSSVPVSRIL